MKKIVFLFTLVVVTGVSFGQKIPASIVLQPSDTIANDYDSASVSLAALGTGITYRWSKNGISVVGATNSLYRFKALYGNNDSFYCIVTADTGSPDTSNTAHLTVLPIAAVVTVQPKDTTGNDYDSASFSVTATGTGTLKYQWKKNSTTISGATSSTYRFLCVYANSGDKFVCGVLSATGDSAFSDTGHLTVSAIAPVITVQPQSTRSKIGNTETFSITAHGTGAQTYQWRLNGNPISLATSASYSTPVYDYTYNGRLYSCVVTNSTGSTTSSNAVLTVVLRPNATGLNGMSHGAFIASWR